MERAGLIKRARTADDKRRAQVWLTPKAKRIRRRMLGLARTINEEACVGVSRQDYDSFQRAIARMSANLDRIKR
jgi:DNA-binding MarR family transcriptional regulator